MDLENLGAGAGSGLIGAALAFLGFKQRIDSLEKCINDMSKAVVYKDAHGECSSAWHISLERLEKKIDRLLEKA